jgi:hypothetical protein
MKGAGAEWVKFVKFVNNIVRASLRSGMMTSPWKEARTILIDKKGDREEIGNWGRSRWRIVCIQIFTRLMAWRIQWINSKVPIFSDSQKGFMKKRIDAANTVSFWTNYYITRIETRRVWSRRRSILQMHLFQSESSPKAAEYFLGIKSFQ